MQPDQNNPLLRRPATTGWIGVGTGSVTGLLPNPTKSSGSTRQVCGLWPFSAGSGAPLIGAPLGLHLRTGSAVCADPIGWFYKGLINNPSAFVMALPALGKSTITRRMVTYAAATGAIPFILGDLKPDYVDLVEELNGQIVELGPGKGHINPLAPGDARDAEKLLTQTIEDCRGILDRALEGDDVTDDIARYQPNLIRVNLVDADGWQRSSLDDRLNLIAQYTLNLDDIRTKLLEDSHARKVTMLSTLLTIQRSGPLKDWEITLLTQALRIVEQQHEVPVISDLLNVIQSSPETLQNLILADSAEDYRANLKPLELSLIGLISGGKLGETFSKHTSQQQRRDSPVVYDVSAITDADADLQGAVLMACWSAGFATINAAHSLADAGLEPQRIYLVVMDELHRALRTGPGMVEKVDILTRLNRNEGVGQVMITHTMKDLDSLPTEEDKQKARGFVERSGMVILGGLPSGEMPLLNQAVTLSQKEQDLLGSWTNPASFDVKHGVLGAPPGRGKFMVKVGGAPGIPIQVRLTDTELAINDTNKRWKNLTRIGKTSGTSQ